MTLQGIDYLADSGRYDTGMPYRRVGRSGLLLPAISLGLWHNFGDDVPMERQRATLRRAFDLGVTHFDLANNYGPPYGSAERVTEGMIAAAAEALASMVNAYRQGAPLLPTMSDLRMVSATVAVAVAKQAEREGLAREPLTDPIQQIYNRMWQPVYPPVEAI